MTWGTQATFAEGTPTLLTQMPSAGNAPCSSSSEGPGGGRPLESRTNLATETLQGSMQRPRGGLSQGQAQAPGPGRVQPLRSPKPGHQVGRGGGTCACFEPAQSPA